MAKKTLLFIIACCSFGILQAQQVFRSRVVSADGRPVAGAYITVDGTGLMLVADADGNFNFSYPKPTFTIEIFDMAYLPKKIFVTGTLPATIVLQLNATLLDTAVVTAYENKMSRKNVAAAVSVIDQGLVQQFNEGGLVPAVNTVAGVKMDERSPGSYRLSIRGNLLRSTFGVRNVKVYWNGIPFTDASGNTYFNELSPENITSMEIIKGPGGSMYGSGTGGVVLLQSRLPDSARHQYADVKISGGSYGFLSVAGALEQTGKKASRLSYSHQQSDGYRQHTNMRRDVMHYLGNFALKGSTRLHANIFLADLFYQTPSALTGSELNADPRQSRPAAGIFQSAATQQAAVYLKTLYAAIGADFTLNKHWTNTTGIYGSYTNFINPTIRNYESKYDRGAGLRTVFHHERNRYISGVIGAELQQGYFHANVFGNSKGVKDTLQFTDEICSRQVNIFFQEDLAARNNFFVSAGMSFNHFAYTYLRASDPTGKRERTRFKPQVLARTTLLKKIRNTSVYFALTQGYSVPTIDEVHAGNDQFNLALKPEEARNQELGIKSDIIPGKLYTELALYHLGLKNTIVSRRDASGGDYYTNAGKTNQWGLEATVNYQPIRNKENFIRTLIFTGSFSRIHAKFDQYQQGNNSFDGNALTGTPPHTLSIGASFQTALHLSLNLQYNYTDHIPVNDANSVYASAYQLLHAKLSYQLILNKTSLDFFTTAMHSFDNPYSLGNDLNAAGNRYYNPAAPNNFTIGAAVRSSRK